jgi:hypothetical protein
MEKDKDMNDRLVVKEKRGFYIHFIIYIMVNIDIFAQWWYITGGKDFA